MKREGLIIAETSPRKKDYESKLAPQLGQMQCPC